MSQDLSKLTVKQREILQKIEYFQHTYNYFPSVRDLSKNLNLKSSNTIFTHLKALETKGYLKKNNKGQIIELIKNKNTLGKIQNTIQQTFSIPFFSGEIPAGFQAPAEDAGREMISLDQFLIKNPNNTFALKVKGDSMEKAGIIAGDLLLVEKRTDVKNGQIVIAHLPSGFTVKRLIKKGNKSYLQAESDKNYQIALEEGTEIWGVVIGSIRKY